MQDIKCDKCGKKNIISSKDLDYKQCINCDQLIKIENKHSKLDEIIKKNVGHNLFDEEEK